MKVNSYSFMKRKVKKVSNKNFWEGEFKVTVSKRLNNLKGKSLATKKLDMVNKELSTMKGLPKL